jgi:hypothetical protein
MKTVTVRVWTVTVNDGDGRPAFFLGQNGDGNVSKMKDLLYASVLKLKSVATAQ